jgi:hypothetical protein
MTVFFLQDALPSTFLIFKFPKQFAKKINIHNIQIQNPNPPKSLGEQNGFPV